MRVSAGLAFWLAMFLVALGLDIYVLGFRSHHASQSSPIHVANTFFDGVNNADFRQTCSVWVAATPKNGGTMLRCEQFLTARFAQAAIFGTWPHYTIVPHSETVNGDSATVKAKANDGTGATVHLVKTRHGWKVSSVG